jgi:serine/threonine protein kinase
MSWARKKAMNAERLHQVEELYHAALELEESQRADFLREICGVDEALRHEVETLLTYAKKAADAFELPAMDLVARALAKDGVHPYSALGVTIGHYRILRPLGEGGMGAVYLAERSDGAFRKQAAIKLVLPSVNSACVIARFQQEREILASLDHPNIAKLLDGGVTEEGWPYFVMEFVDGRPIDEWCDERKLNISRRIELFRDVISAVQYAHRCLVVHRDLKPGNILVTNDGTVKLLDFGIAKVLAASDAGKAAETKTLARMMTPEYASPEQVNGYAITTLSDVYSLGVTLYELLTGHRPYRLVSATVHELARVIADMEPPRPSDVVATIESGAGRDRTPITPNSVSAVREGDPIRLRKRLSGDLDSILLMALEKEPERRYGSAESLAEDLQRHLEHRPVTAREATPWYTAKRFCRRNPGAVAAAVLAALSLLAGAATLIWQARHGLQTASLDSADVFLLPVLAYLSALAAIALGAAVYFLRPGRTELLASTAGGVALGIAGAGKWWVEYNLGWWQSRFLDTPDPLMVLSPLTWLTFPLFGTLFLLPLSVVGRRFGWKGQAISLVFFGFYEETQEHVCFSNFIPALTYEMGLTPILGGAAMLIAGAVMGLLVMRLIAGPTPRTVTAGALRA